MQTYSTALGLLLLAGSAAAADTGFYVGLGAGSSDFNSNLGSEIRAAYTQSSAYVVDDARLRDGSDQAFQFRAGYRFLPWLSAELGWTDAGEARGFFALTSTVPLTNGHAAIDSRYRLRGVSGALVGEFPIVDDRLHGVVRAGAVRTRLAYDESGTDANNGPHRFEARDENDTSPLAGIGLSWSFTPNWELRADWDRWFDVGRTFDLTAHGNGKFGHVDLYTMNLIYRIGR